MMLQRGGGGNNMDCPFRGIHTRVQRISFTVIMSPRTARLCSDGLAKKKETE